jgi:protein-S-isoprenylcysteine O-methyltransferase Ste14
LTVRAAFVAAGVLYGFVAILLAASLPARVPVRFGTGLTADRWTSRGQLMLPVGCLAYVFGWLARVVTARRGPRPDLATTGTADSAG